MQERSQQGWTVRHCRRESLWFGAGGIGQPATWSACASCRRNMCVSIDKVQDMSGQTRSWTETRDLTYHQIQTYPELFTGHHLLKGCNMQGQ